MAIQPISNSLSIEQYNATMSAYVESSMDQVFCGQSRDVTNIIILYALEVVEVIDCDEVIQKIEKKYKEAILCINQIFDRTNVELQKIIISYFPIESDYQSIGEEVIDSYILAGVQRIRKMGSFSIEPTNISYSPLIIVTCPVRRLKLESQELLESEQLFSQIGVFNQISVDLDPYWVAEKIKRSFPEGELETSEILDSGLYSYDPHVVGYHCFSKRVY